MLALSPKIVFVCLFVCLPSGMPCDFFLVAEHDVLGNRNSSKEVFSNTVERWEVGGILQSYGLSRLVSLCLWTSNFTRVSQVFSSPLGWDIRVRTGWICLLPSHQIVRL